MATMPPSLPAVPRVLTQHDFDRFARLSRDDNPIHCDPAFARGTHFGATVAHGMLLFSLLCAQMRRGRAGPVLPLAQTLMFPQPTYVGDAVVAELVPGEGAAGRVALRTAIRCVQRGGRALSADEAPVTASGEAELLLDPDAAALAGPSIGGAAGAVAAVAGDAALYHLRPGQQADAVRSFERADIDDYVALSEDANPLYTDTALARRRGFDGPVVPLPLLAGMFSDLLGTRLPGRGTGWMKQSLRLRAAARLGEPLRASVRIVRLRTDKELVNLATDITGEGGRLVLQGEALVLVRNLEKKGAGGAEDLGQDRPAAVSS
ncbi:MaoC family dehydratase N-terminal domain-containing protein [Cupriavidus gilardii]|nr:MaoC family dehydratase N-terminal domain-containing protein [Cupriavidus gilardii]